MTERQLKQIEDLANEDLSLSEHGKETYLELVKEIRYLRELLKEASECLFEELDYDYLVKKIDSALQEEK